MAHVFSVSLPDEEKKLVEWIKERRKNKDISNSLVFRDAMMEKKKEWDSLHSKTNPSIIKDNEKLREALKKQAEAFEILPEEWKKKTLDFMINADSSSTKKQKGFITEIKKKNIESEEENLTAHDLKKKQQSTK